MGVMDRSGTDGPEQAALSGLATASNDHQLGVL
jgi:hypothetical protein